MSTGADYILSLDLGQANDFTALCVVERLPGVVNATTHWREPVYHLRYLERPALGTLYTTIVERVTGLLATPPLSPDTPLVVDQTGVGAGIVDMFTAAGLRPRAITITGGNAVTWEDPYQVTVPKRDLVSALVALFQSKRLIVADGLALAPTLINELLNFKMKVNLKTGHDSYEAWRESVHDDLLLAVALAVWYAGNRPVAAGAHQYVAGGEGRRRPLVLTTPAPYPQRDASVRHRGGVTPQSDEARWGARRRPTGD